MGFMRGFQAGQTSDLEAYNRLVTENQDIVYTLAYFILGSKTAAERAAQSAFMQAFQGSGGRKIATYNPLFYRSLVDAIQQELKGIKKSFPNVEQPGEEAGRDVWIIFQRLPPDLRLAAALVDVAGLDYEQASEALRVNVREIRRSAHFGESAQIKRWMPHS